MSAGSATIDARLRRLRVRLVMLATAIAAVGPMAVGWRVIRIDEAARLDRLQADLDRRVTTTRSLLSHDDGVVPLDRLSDPVLAGPPPFFVVTADDRVVFSESRVQLDPVPLAREVIIGEGEHLVPGSADRLLVADLVDGGGRAVRVVGRPFVLDGSDEAAGAILAVGALDEGRASHEAMVRTVAVGSLSVLAGLVVLNWVVITRSLAPSAEALEQKERFVGDAAHELRRPLASLRAVAESALASGGTTPDSEVALRRSVAIVDDASRLLDDLLALARLDPGGPGRAPETQATRLDLLVEAVLAERDGVTLTAARPVVVEIDPALVERAVVNLVDNALHHGRPPVEVVVDEGSVRVLDRGPGFPDDGGADWFERFRSGRARGGTGIGLALVAAVARVHGGWVSAGPRSDGPGAEVTLGLR